MQYISQPWCVCTEPKRTAALTGVVVPTYIEFDFCAPTFRALLCLAVPCCAVLCCAGEPMRYAKAALLTGLLKLDPSDRFALVGFDHDQQWWTGALMAYQHSAGWTHSSPRHTSCKSD